MGNMKRVYTRPPKEYENDPILREFYRKENQRMRFTDDTEKSSPEAAHHPLNGPSVTKKVKDDLKRHLSGGENLK
ncbi:hypothetical protein [Actinopolyspora halophila]|uniref:hypothetical protein n=1 Tax=Actinopolyspora halophila TaxID=1850 RepID=UPI000382B40F|nr:hypothetical protein [Actinopolyspora halophila]